MFTFSFPPKVIVLAVRVTELNFHIVGKRTKKKKVNSIWHATEKNKWNEEEFINFGEENDEQVLFGNLVSANVIS